MSRVVLVTGVAGDLGRRFARRLADAPGISRVIGVDVIPPRADIGAMQFVRADIRNPVIAKVIVREQVDTVVHLGIVAHPAAAGGRNAMKELNVIGTMQLLAACQQAPDLEHLVVKSSAAVYGASSRDPAMFTEESGPKRNPRSGFAKDVAEIESYVRGFARRRGEVRVTTLRMASMMGPLVDTPLTRYFRLPVIPTVLGFDPRLQFVHEHDVHGAIEQAVLEGVPGTFNIAGDGTMMLSQAVRRLGRPTVPMPPFGLAAVASAMRQTHLVDFSREEIGFLTYGRGMDNSRMRSDLGYTPAYTTEETFADFASSVKPGLLRADRVRAAEAALGGALAGAPARERIALDASGEGHSDG